MVLTKLTMFIYDQTKELHEIGNIDINECSLIMLN